MLAGEDLGPVRDVEADGALQVGAEQGLVHYDGGGEEGGRGEGGLRWSEV